MITVERYHDISCGHRVVGHESKCKFLHGHNYRVRLCVSAEELDPLGMVIDFGDLKEIAREVLGRFDHSVLNEHPPFDGERNTTAEQLAEYVFHEVARRLPAGRRMRRVEVRETDTSTAIYEA